MKYSPEQNVGEMLPQTADLLQELRERRNFDPETYIDAKSRMLNQYMSDSNLSSCVVAISGGIDSALVLGLVANAAEQPSSPIKEIYPIALPVYRDEFTKNQDKATKLGSEVCEAFNLDLIKIDLTKPYDAMKLAVDASVGIKGEPWAAGQLVAYLRTPANYYMTSLTTQSGHGGIVCGTTNRDEGAYLGYVGKASDGIVDVQLISDLHKSEVRRLSRYLGVPESVLESTPAGDMFDGRVDEEVFGASYDYVEMFLMLKSLPPDEAEANLQALNSQERQAYEEAAHNLEELHGYNSHKYNVGSPAVHLDVLESGVPGGWTYARQKVGREAQGQDKFVNAFELSGNTLDVIYSDITQRSNTGVDRLDIEKGEAVIMRNAVTQNVIETLLADADENGWQPVGIDGIASHYKEGDEIGSLRATTFSPVLADYLWSRISPNLSNPLINSDDPQVDVEPGSIWRPIGVSPLMRFIRYDSGGLLVPHYDAPFEYSEGIMTLKSLVLYLDATGIKGGTTRFIKDDRIEEPINARDLSDREQLANESDINIKVDPEIGSTLVFDHRLLHDSEPVESVSDNGRKVIVRTDVVYAKC